MDSLMAAIPLPALLVSYQERILAANAEGSALLGGAVAGRHLVTVLRQPRTLSAVESTLRDATPREARYTHVDGGNETQYLATVRPVGLESAKGVLVVFQDITQLEQAGQARRDFVANVSHELRTPLTAIMGFIETLRTAARDDPAARDRFLSIMASEAHRMNRLVDDLLSLSRVEEVERERPKARINPVDVIRSVALSLAPLAEENGARINVVVPETAPEIPADGDQLRQVLMNLVENALKYGGQGVEVTIGLSPPAFHGGLRGEAVELTVSDTGPGIADHHLPRLTERFYRIDNHRSREMGGTGLGLAIVKHIVGRHRGRLKVDSTLGEGTRFSVILPVD